MEEKNNNASVSKTWKKQMQLLWQDKSFSQSSVLVNFWVE